MFVQFKLPEIATFHSMSRENHDTDWMSCWSLNQFYFYVTKHKEYAP